MNTGSTYCGYISVTVMKMTAVRQPPQNSDPIPNRMLNEQKQPTGFKYNMCCFHKQLGLEDKPDLDGNFALVGDHLLLLALFALMEKLGGDVISGPSGSEVRGALCIRKHGTVCVILSEEHKQHQSPNIPIESLSNKPIKIQNGNRRYQHEKIGPIRNTLFICCFAWSLCVYCKCNYDSIIVIMLIWGVQVLARHENTQQQRAGTWRRKASILCLIWQPQEVDPSAHSL